MVLFANRVSAPRCAPKMASTSGTPKDFAARWTLPKSSRHLSIVKTGELSDSTGISRPDFNIAETRRAGTMPGPDHLLRLALAAIRNAPQHPMIAVGDGLARIPELGCNAAIGW